MHQITLNISDEVLKFLKLFLFTNPNNYWIPVSSSQEPWNLVWDESVSVGFQEAKSLAFLEEDYGEYRISGFGEFVVKNAKRVDEGVLYNVVIHSYGLKKINAIKAVRYITDMGLKEAKELVEETESRPAVVLKAVSKDEAEAALKILRDGSPLSSAWDNSCPGLQAAIVPHKGV